MQDSLSIIFRITNRDRTGLEMFAYPKQKTGLYPRIATALVPIGRFDHAQNNLLKFKRKCRTRGANFPKYFSVLTTEDKILHPVARRRYVPPNRFLIAAIPHKG